MAKIVVVVLAGVGAFLHQRATSKAQLALWGSVGGHGQRRGAGHGHPAGRLTPNTQARRRGVRVPGPESGLTWIPFTATWTQVKENLMLADIFGPDLLIVAIVLVVLLFGGAAIPKLARNLGSAKNRVREGARGGEEGRRRANGRVRGDRRRRPGRGQGRRAPEPAGTPRPPTP